MLQSQITDYQAGKLLLRWSDDPEQAAREVPVEVLESRLSEAIIRSVLQIHERTEVQLIGRGYHEAGIVRSCRPEGARFILTIGITSAPELEDMRFQRDPGVLSVEGFLTEEEADHILDELDRESGSDYDESSARCCAAGQFFATIRLLKFSNVLNRLCAIPRLNDQCLWLNKV